ncbi:MAG: hypothetical protein HKP61_20420 [Dactylosporangium sp.]|nr:hypothetical protein [Dactylosporangium sp.]NNJ63249.1 hypothetical protein [Dactylosporangium sp.]
MPTLTTAVDPRAPHYVNGRSIMLERLRRLASAIDSAPGHAAGARVSTPRAGDGFRRAHHRIELLIDRDTPLLELSPAAGRDPGHAGPGLVTALGVVEGALCVLVADDPSAGTSPAGAGLSQYTLVKASRAAEIGRANRLPLIYLMDRLAGRPTIDIDPLFPQLATRRDLRGLSPDQVLSTIGLIRRVIAQLTHPATPADRVGPAPTARIADPPLHSETDLLGLAPDDPTVPFDPREILARILDGSRFDEFDEPGQRHASALCAGWGAIHGYPVAVLADSHNPPPEDITKAIQFVQLSETSAVPLVVLRCASTPAAGRDPGGPDQDVPELMFKTVANARIPHLAVHLGTAPGGGDSPRFRFRWPSAPACGADDGYIDPRDTRTVLGLCLAAIAGMAPIRRTAGLS